MHDLDRCQHGQHFNHSDDCFWNHQTAVLEDQKRRKFPVVLVGDDELTRAHQKKLRAIGLKVRRFCEDRSGPPGQKRFFLCVSDAGYDAALSALQASLGSPHSWYRRLTWLSARPQPPFIVGLCTKHPRWTYPCPDCYRM